MKNYRAVNLLKIAAWVTSMVLWVAAALCYWLRPDRFAVVTIYPAWTYCLLGLLLAALGASRRARARTLVPFLLWLIFILVFADQFGAMASFRRWPSRDWQNARDEGRAVRVISLNCGGGSTSAAAEAFAYQPDIVLFQESPPEQALRKLVQEVVGNDWSVVYGLDTSIAARGTTSIGPLPSDVRAFATRAFVTTKGGIEIDVTSLRLLPPVLCLNLFSPNCWRMQTANRQDRREQVAALVRAVDGSDRALPAVVGGDFNAPAGDGALQPLRAHLRDASIEGGVGWGDTATNDIPLLRIDQVWISDEFHVSGVVARETQHSDHRMVICDLIANRPRTDTPP